MKLRSPWRLPGALVLVWLVLASLVHAPPAHAEPPSRPPSPAKTLGEAPAALSCPARLVALRLDTRAAPSDDGRSGPCTIVDPIIVTAIHPVVEGDPVIALPDAPLISCAMAEAFGTYVQDIAAPLAKGTFGVPLAEIGTGPGFECRTRNHVAGAKVSAHAQGDAIDIAAITLGDRTAIKIDAPADERARRFLFALRAAGCGAFSTVLGPGSDAFHATHFHFDIEARGRDGKSKFCQ